MTDKKLMVDQILVQRDLALRLAQTGDVGPGLSLVLETAIKASGMECGGIWLKQAGNEDFELISSIGLSRKLERKVSLLAHGSRPWKRIVNEKHTLTALSSESMPSAHAEGINMPLCSPYSMKGRL